MKKISKPSRFIAMKEDAENDFYTNQICKKIFSSSIYFENKKVGTDYVNQSINSKTIGPLYYLRYMPLI